MSTLVSESMLSKLMKESSISKTLPGGLAVSWVVRRKARRLRATGLVMGAMDSVSLGVDSRSLTRRRLSSRAETGNSHARGDTWSIGRLAVPLE